MRLLIATTNAGKVREFAEMLGTHGWEWTDLSAWEAGEPVEETGRTFRANACLKAAEYARRTKMWTLADDSGLEVDALGGRPGVYSARWAQMNGAGAGDAANNALLIEQLRGIPESRRAGRFVCVLALAEPGGRVVVTVRRTVEGRVLEAPRGANGFGYDPLFYVESLGRTTAELAPAEKHRISHRGQAVRACGDLMDRLHIR